MTGLLERLVYPGFRHIDFRGKGRLRDRLPVPAEGERDVRFPGGMRLRLDLRESLQRDFLFGLYDQRELGLLRRFLAAGGDMVDVGAHIGMYTVAAALVLRGRGRVLAFEPNPHARRQLEANLALNEVDNAIVRPVALAAQSGEALLHVPQTSDPSFSSLAAGRFAEGDPVTVSTSTLDEEVRAAGLSPKLVKIDVEGAEVDVLAGADETLATLPVLLVEVGEATAAAVEQDLAARGYRAFVVGRRLVPGLSSVHGLANALFVPA